MARTYRVAALLLLNTLLLLAAAEGLAAGFLWITGARVDGPPSAAAARMAPAVAADLDRLTLDYWPYVGWRAHPMTSTTLNVDAAGNRVTPGAACGQGAFTVFVFGGSVAFGFGVADTETIPALLQRGLEERLHKPVCVRNLAQLSWTSTQETVALLRELQEGRSPDLAIFIDGFNDVNVRGGDGVGGRSSGDMDYDGRAVWIRSTTHAGWIAAREVARSTHLSLLLGWARERLRAPETDARPPAAAQVALPSPEAVLRAYLTNHDTVRLLASAHGFRAAWFWQPTLWVKDTRTPDEELLLQDAAPPDGVPGLFDAVYRAAAAEARTRDGLTYLGGIFDGTSSMYVDDVHVVRAGNARIAEAIVDVVAPPERPSAAESR